MDQKNLVDQSIDYIMQHLNEDLSLDKVAAHFFISKYHFSRIFKEATGESVYAFIKRCRIDQSAIDIKLDPTRSLTDIGLDYGYSASNYSTVFKKHRHISPARFRQSLPTQSIPIPFAPERTAHFKSAAEYDALIERQELDDLSVLYERIYWKLCRPRKNWYQFLDTHQNYMSETTMLVERFFHDPSITSSAQCICDIGMTVEADCHLSHVLTIKGGQWLVYPFVGKISDIFETLQGIFSVWLPQSGYKMSQPYGLNMYHHIDRDAHQVVMDLYIPIA